MRNLTTIVREQELRELVAALDGAITMLELCGYRDAHDDALTLPLRDYFRLNDAMRRAADYLAELRYLGRCS
jgi:hypothetical protein